MFSVKVDIFLKPDSPYDGNSSLWRLGTSIPPVTGWLRQLNEGCTLVDVNLFDRQVRILSSPPLPETGEQMEESLSGLLLVLPWLII